MGSIIITSKDPQKGFEEALKITSEKKIGKFDLEVLEFDKAMGIPDVRLLKSKLFLKPLGNEKAVIIKLLDTATIEAQNAMLKILEEPPSSANLILIAESLEIFLPTIISRCRVIKIESDEKTDLDVSVLEESLNEKFLTAQNLARDKREAVNFLESAIFFLKQKSEDESRKGNYEEAKKHAEKLKILLETYNVAKNTNANLRLALENLFLSL